MGIKRRYFLQNTGILLAGSSALLNTPEQAQTRPMTGRPTLITNGDSELAQVIASELEQDREVKLTGLTEVDSRFPYSCCELGHDVATNDLVRGMDSIVHVADFPPESHEFEYLDYLTRRTYNLLRAASEASVRRIIFLSTLEIMTDYDEDFLVTEVWRPVPTTAPPVLAKHLGEYTCREFAREGKVQVVVLRLGKVVKEVQVKGQKLDPLWVEEREVAQSVAGALDVQLYDHSQGVSYWKIFHIQSEFPGARFPVGAAKGTLGYKPWFKP